MNGERSRQRLEERHARGSGAAPHRFRWRSRAYRVDEVLDSWFEPTAWWLGATGREGLGGLGADGRVWRVLASTGSGGAGTFELAEATPATPASVRAVD